MKPRTEANPGLSQRDVGVLRCRGEQVSQVPALASSYRFSTVLGGSAAPLGLGFCNWQLAFFPPPLSRALLLLLGCSTPPRISGGGGQAPPLPTGAQRSREHGEWSPGSERALRGICFFRAPATRVVPPSPLLHFSPRLQSHGILRMLERWR